MTLKYTKTNGPPNNLTRLTHCDHQSLLLYVTACKSAYVLLLIPLFCHPVFSGIRRNCIAIIITIIVVLAGITT